MVNQIQAKTNNAVKTIEQQFEEKKPLIEDVINNIVLANYKPEFGYSEREIAEKKQNAHLFLLKLLSAKDSAKRPAILTVSEESIRECALTFLNGGYDLFKNQGYLFPYGNELKFMVSKDGYVALAKKTNPDIKDFYAEIVYKGDEFEFEKVAGKTIITKHKQKLENITANWQDVVAAYATCEFKDGTHIADVMTIEEIKNSLATAQKGITDIHKKNPKIMLSKFPLRRLAKTRIYQSNPEIANIIVDEEVEFEAVNTNDTIAKNMNVSFDQEISQPLKETVVVEQPQAEIIIEENPFKEFENEDWTIEDMEDVINQIENEEQKPVEIEKPKELETKTVYYSKWKNELKDTGEWELVQDSYDANKKTVKVVKKDVK